MQGTIIALCAALVAGAVNGSSAIHSPSVPGEFFFDLDQDGNPERLLWHRQTGKLRLFLPNPDGGEDTVSLWSPPGPGRPGAVVRSLTPDGGLDFLILGRAALYVFPDAAAPVLRPPALVVPLPGEPHTPLDSTGLDAAVVEITAPVGEVDSNALVTPAAWIANLSPVGCSIPVRFDIGEGYSETTRAYVGSFQARQFLFPGWRALPLGGLAVRCSTMLPGDTWNANDMIADSISVIGRRDAAAMEILAPTGTVDSGAPIVPMARIANQGTSAESIPVRLSIGTTYHDTVFVLLQPGRDTALSFRTWQAEPVGLLNIRCSTMLTDDERPANNRVSGSVIVKPLVDAAALAVLAPVGALDSGTVVTPRATVANLSTTARSFPVRLAIGSAYADTVSVNLAPRETTTISFRDWTASPLGFLAVRCSTMLAGDENGDNDTADGIVEVGVRIDAWARTILAPTGTVDSGTVVTPAAQLTNNGTRPAHIPARLTIGDDYNRTDSLFLAPGASGTVFFPSWSAAPIGLLAVRCSTALAGDTFPANDTVSASVTVIGRTDAELSAILAPVGTTDSGTVIIPRVVVTNNGTRPESIPVRITIGDDYDEPGFTTLGPGGQDTLAFPAWTAQPVGTIPVTAWTHLAGDEDPANDTARTTVIVSELLDAMPLAILRPAGTLDSGSVVTPLVRVANNSSSRQDVPVRLEIGPDYSDIAIVSLDPGASDTVGFMPWTATTPGINAVRCSTALEGDSRPENDTLSSTVTVTTRIDAAAVTIVAPTGVVDSGTVITPQALVTSHSTSPALVPVRLTIGDGYADTTGVTVAPGETLLVSFRDWTAAPVGPLAVRCSTMLAGDENPANDTLSETVTVTAKIDAGVTAILAPFGTVDSGATITPLVRVINNSVSPKEVPVRLDIGDHYAETRTRYFPPGQEDTVAFPVWSAHLLGHHLVRCSTMLEGDEDPANDTLSTVIEVRTWVDAEAIALLAPTGVVDSGATVIPAALVRNNSGGERTFTVRLAITPGYEDLVLVTLRPGTDTTTAFRPWFASEVGTFVVFCSTGLDGDMDPANDTLLGQVVVAARRDVGAYRIVAPTGSVDSGAVVNPEAMVANYGTGSETFAVRLAVGAGYADTQYVSVSPQDSALVSFQSWTAGPGGWQTVRCSTMLDGDENPGNDAAGDSVLVLNRPDAAVSDLYLPRGRVDSGAVVVPLARICNYGLTPVIVPVMMRIGPDYLSIRHKYLDIGAKDTVAFEPWTATLPGRHAVTCSTMLVGDENPANDAKRDSVFITNRFDAATVAIITPQGTVDSGTVVEPAVIAANYGTTPELVPVRLRIGEDYDELVIRRITPGSEDTLHFPAWSAGPPGTVAVLCSTELAGDQDNSNDYLLRTVRVRVGNDAAALEILAPRGVADSGDVIIPVARIANYSTGPREIPVLMRIEEGYFRTRRKTLGPGESDTVAFPAWRAGPAGTLMVTCSTALHADEVEKNNSVRGSVFVNHELDAAVTEIIVPGGLVDSGRTITPKARISNLGPGPVGITVEMRIGDNYNSLRTKLLDPAVSDTVHFDPWTARPVGTHAVRCTTRLEGDRNPTNDFLDGTVSVHWRDAAAAAILGPTGTLRAGDTVTPSALIRNAGTSTERIPAVFRIGPDYAWTAHSESLAPGDTALLSFPPWVVTPGPQTVSCSTALPGDMHPTNDKISATVTGTDRAVLLYPDSSLTASPGAAVDYHVTCVNLGNSPDTIDITTSNTRPGWQVILLDSTGTTPLHDHNGNSLPDLGALAPGESCAFVCRVVVPLEELGTAVDSTRVRGSSGSDPRVWDEVLLHTAVGKIASIIIEPDRRGETPPGQPIRHRFTVSNLGNVPDYADLILSSAKGDWRHDLLDEDGKQLPDRNNSGRPDVGPLDPLGGSCEITLVVVPDAAARIGSTDTSHVSAVSFADENVRDDARAITVVAGSVTDIVLESDWQRTLGYGDTALLPMSVRTVGTVPVTVNLSSSGAASDWLVRFLHADRHELLRDTDHDGNPDLPDVPPGTPTGFAIAVTAPGDRGLTGNPDSLGPARVTIVAAVSGAPAAADSALLTLTLAPPLEVHNYPNPAQLRTTFIFSLPVAGRASLRVYGRLGELVAEVAAPASFEAGVHRIEWLLRDRSGRRLAPGTYYYLLEFTTDDEETVRRIGRLAVRTGDER